METEQWILTFKSVIYMLSFYLSLLPCVYNETISVKVWLRVALGMLGRESLNSLDIFQVIFLCSGQMLCLSAAGI